MATGRSAWDRAEGEGPAATTVGVAEAVVAAAGVGLFACGAEPQPTNAASMPQAVATLSHPRSALLMWAITRLRHLRFVADGMIAEGRTRD